MTSSRTPLHTLWSELHEAACLRGEEFYTDPETGYLVGTRVRLLARGACCDSGCRHCPYRETSNPARSEHPADDGASTGLEVEVHGADGAPRAEGHV